MAAVDQPDPNVDDFLGLNWSCWVDRVRTLPSDADCNENSSKCGRNQSESTTLRKEDMHIYGHCPAHDDLFLVVCSHCSQVVKPQAFQKHCERRHGPLARSCPGKPPSNLSSSRGRQRDGRHKGGAQSSAELPVRQKHTKTQEAVSLPSVENPLLPHHSSSTPCPRVPPRPSRPLAPGRCSSSSPPLERPSVQTFKCGQSSESHYPFWEQRTFSQIEKNIESEECNLNKHCGGLTTVRKKLCSRELTSSADSSHHQQKTPGAKDKEQHLEEKITTQGTKYKFNSKYQYQFFRDQFKSFPEEDGDSTVVDVQPPYPFNHSFVLSEESEDDEQEEAAHMPSTSWHPKPLGLCTFGCRTLGCNIFTFDRRWHHLCFALTAMMEHHVSTDLWKKMPQVSSSGLMSQHTTPPTVRTGARPSQANGSLSLASTSMKQLETKTSQRNFVCTKPPSSTPSASHGP